MQLEDITKVVEIKFLSDESMLLNKYLVPIYHACQLLCEMYVKPVQEAWYIICSEHTVLLTTVQFNDKIWSNLWTIIKEGYYTTTSTRPLKVDKERQSPKVYSQILWQRMQNLSVRYKRYKVYLLNQ